MNKPSALLVGYELSNWMVKKGYTISDVQRGLVSILNPGKGNTKGKERSSNHGAVVHDTHASTGEFCNT